MANHVGDVVIQVSRGIATANFKDLCRRENLPPTREDAIPAMQQRITGVNHGYILAFRPDFIHLVEIAIEKYLVEFRISCEYSIIL